MAIEKWSVEQFVQLGMGLVLDEAPSPYPPPEGGGDATLGEAQDFASIQVRREAARRAFEMRMAKPGTGRSAEAAAPGGEASSAVEDVPEGTASPLQAGGVREAEWLGDYLMLREAGWPWGAAVYVAWAASPKAKRWPRTVEELATEVLGLAGPRVIYQWKRRNPAMDDVIAMLQAAPLFVHRRDIFDALIESATNPDYKGHQDRKLALELLGDYTPRSEAEVKVGVTTDLSELSDAELERLAGVNTDLARITRISPSPQPSPQGGEGEDSDGN